MYRTRVSLDGEWDFFCDPERNRTARDLEGLRHYRVQVPAPWQAHEPLREYTDLGWYRHRFEVHEPDRLPEHEYYLYFGAVDYHAQVWLNGVLLGEHEGGYLPFEVMTGEALQLDGVNELAVRVIDPPNDADFAPEFCFSEIPHGKQSWYGYLSGIWQSVHLERRARTHMSGLRITPDVAAQQAQVLVQLNQPAPRDWELVLRVADRDGKTTEHRFIWERGLAQRQFTVPVADPILWDTLDPHLYEIHAQLNELPAAGAIVDALADRFGMRTIATSEDGHLRLNGRILFLRGALDQSYYPELIYTAFSEGQLEEQFRMAKHMGLNCIRTHIKINDPRYYDAADRAGVLIWSELPNWENLSELAKRRARETLTGMVLRDWNHPSIVIWTIINEGWGLDLAVNSEHRAWLAEMYSYLKQLDPTRLAVGNSPCFTNFHVVTDIEDFHNYYAIPDHYRQWQEWVQAFAARPPWTFAHPYENINAWRAFTRDPWNPTPRTPAPEVRRRGSEPMVVSEFGNWGLPDVPQLFRCYGDKEPWWFETGADWGGGVVYPHGIEARFRDYHLDRVFGSVSGLAAASQRSQFLALKYQIEQIRRYPSIVGYIITEFTDLHWEANGLLDICRNPKSFYDLLANVNSADALVPVGWDRVAFTEGERFEVRLELSHFSSTDLRGCRVEWELGGWPEIRGTFADLAPKPAHLTRVGTIAFQIPHVDQSRRLQLHFRLRHPSGEELTHNWHEIYLFPRAALAPHATVRIGCPVPRLANRLRNLGYDIVENMEDAEVIVVKILTDDLRLHIQRGGRVLWLADTEDAQQTHLGQLAIKRRHGHIWQGDWASSLSWIRQDRMFDDIPSAGLVDFAFMDLTPEHVIDGMRPRDFAAQVYAGLFVGWVHATVALVAERLIGSGRLLISTFRLANHLGDNPVATIMMHDLLQHLAAQPTPPLAAPASLLQS